MDATRAVRVFRSVRAVGLGVAIVWLGSTVEASPLGSRGMRSGLAAQSLSTSSETNSLAARWSVFLAGGETTWASQSAPPFTLPVRMALLTLIQGDPEVAAASPLVEYFTWRRNLDPERFDRYHPFLGPQIPQIVVPPTPIIPPVPSVPPVEPVDPPITPPVPIEPPVVPEPPALLVIALGVAGAMVLRRRTQPASP